MSNMWSVMSGKMEGIPALNTSPLTNNYCKSQAKNKKSICSECYSIRMLLTFRKNAVPKFELNTKILSSRLLEAHELPPPAGLVARFNGHGELKNSIHFRNILKMARLYPKVTFTLWSKRKRLIQRILKESRKPKNLILVYSNSITDTVMDYVPSGFDKVFNVVRQDRSDVNCHKKCIECLMCYDVKNKTEQIIERIK